MVSVRIAESNMTGTIPRRSKKMSNKESDNQNEKKVNSKESDNQKTDVGRSEVTQYKQQELAKYLPLQITKIIAARKSVQKRQSKAPWQGWWTNESAIFLIDASAGDMNPDFITSPQLFLQESFRRKEDPIDLVLIERGFSSEGKNKNFELLQQRYDDQWKKDCPSNVNVYLHKEEFQSWFEKLCSDIKEDIGLESYQEMKGVYGILYFDPNGFQVEPYESISKFCRKFPQVEILLNINTNRIIAHRKVSAKGFEKYKDIYLSTLLRDIGKKFIWVRDNDSIPCTNRYKFITVYASNWEASKPNGGVFHKIDSPKGQEIIQKHNYSKKEIE